MAPSINNFDVTSVANTTDNKLVKLISFVSKPTCNGGEACQSTAYNFLPGLFILLSVFIIIFFSMKLRGYSTLGTFTACSIANFVIALLLYPLEVISGKMLLISIVLLPISGALLWFASR